MVRIHPCPPLKTPLRSLFVLGGFSRNKQVCWVLPSIGSLTSIMIIVLSHAKRYSIVLLFANGVLTPAQCKSDDNFCYHPICFCKGIGREPQMVVRNERVEADRVCKASSCPQDKLQTRKPFYASEVILKLC